MEIKIHTTSTIVHWPITEDPVLPAVRVGNSPLKGEGTVASPAGVQVVVLSGRNPSTVQLNRYYSLPAQRHWYLTYMDMWNTIAGDVKPVAADHSILIVATFGIHANMPPTDAAATLLRRAGAGQELTQWIENCQPGSQSGNPTMWIDHPLAYAFVGVFVNTSSAEKVSRSWNQAVTVDLDTIVPDLALAG